MKRTLKILKILAIALLSLVALLFITLLVVWQNPEFGGDMDESSLAKAEASPQYYNDHFENNPEALPNDLMTNIREMRGDQIRIPASPFPIEIPQISDTVSSGINATWFGHATVYVEMDGKRIMTDPMLSNKAFLVKMIAPERYNPPPISVEELPAIDIVTISHDHFDHLDMNTAIHLADNGTLFFVGIGIKAHLMTWGISEEQIYEMDWWESVSIDDFIIHCIPARHYSGRKWMDNSTLWTSWVIESPEHQIYHSGDTGYGPHFKEVHEKFGPMDISFIKVGDYGEDLGWQDIHMPTERSVEAARDLNSKIMFPIHWGTFSLSYHDWFEPINLAVQYAREKEVVLVTPKLGETINADSTITNEQWWKPLELEQK
ncbi:MAG: hypothetical protein ED557_13225 [Balneola sp.]|nr:MAG: hypothetical protein ED557_13225 [Balneola sp.]